ncbi:hypothetical protein FANTH_3653 [Fusarium anthophilum]|uniref:Uncharacterized protein n=1 Tax=Fusarium anthophilum TaxID=48485 RepID=A0A8H4ZR31_9HYPO|nr:hypothetical protein FANTH_3653 [Fusarium anthophilum]
MSSSGDEDEVESVVLSEPTELESDSDHHHDHDSDLDLDSDADSDSALSDLDEHAYSPTMCYPTCGLCRFEFVEGEEFVVYKPLSRLYPRIWYGKYDPFVPRRLVIEHGYHQACVAFVQPGPLIKNWLYRLFHVTSGSSEFIEVPSSFTIRRTQWIKQTIATDLRQALGGRLPEEIYRHIASFCVRERACQLLRDLWLDHGTPDNDIIKAFYIGRYTSVWAQHVEVEGLRYIKSLSTRRVTQQDTLVFKARFKKRSATNRPEAFLNIYSSRDHLGIRDIIITEDEELPALEMESGLSWVVHRRQKTPLRFTSRDDNIKLRSLEIHHTMHPDFTYQTRNWGVLPENFSSFPLIPLATNSYLNYRLYFESVRSVDWNSPGVCGYSFYVDRNLIRGIVSHKFGEPEPKKRDEYGTADDLWFHMPIDPDERVSELWLRRGKLKYSSDTNTETLIVRTTKGRSFTPGLGTACGVPVDGTLKFTYKAIAIFPTEGSSRMFYCRAKWLWTYFTFEQPPGLGNEGDLQGVTSWDQNEIQHSFPLSDIPLISLYHFVETSVSLSGVRSITPCRGWKSEFSHEVVGLVLTYGDGRRRCIGQVRLDCLDAPLQIYSNHFWLGLVDLEDGEPDDYRPWHMKVISFHLSEPEPDDDTRYIKIPFSGRLDWAVFGFASAVRHVEEGEPYDEIGQVMAGGKKVLDYASREIKTFAVPIRVREAKR